MFKFELGIEVKSIISGFKGIIVGRADHLNGCNRYWLQPKVDKEGKYRDGYWIDEQELVIIGKTKIKTENKKPGGFPSKIK